ncbi:MAG: polysaccharide deacetylase family protein [Victivallales bacterium]|nr:polysaccharide deacetylase family protein [Victivallales bacterium]
MKSKLTTFLLLLIMAVTMTSCAGRNGGALCITLDDRYFQSWDGAIPFFAKYDARVTFFVYGGIDDTALAYMKKLQDAGHTIGLHSLTHAKAGDYYQANGDGAYTAAEIMPQLKICQAKGIRIRAFAYPSSQRTPETDAELFRNFDFLRTNCSAVKGDDQPLAEADGCFVKNPAAKQLFYGVGVGGDFDVEAVKAAIRRAAEEESVLVLYAHDITKEIPPSHHIAYSQLEAILEYAREVGLPVRGLNEL